MSYRLRLFNFLLRIFAQRGLTKLSYAEDVSKGFKEHARKSDLLIKLFVKHLDQPLLKTEHDHWVWVGNPKAMKRHVLYLHGGGFTAHLPSTYRYWADRLSQMNDAAVLVVDYPLVPTDPYPVGINDCLNAYRWMVEEQNIDPANIVIGGDSAGANLAIATLLKIKEAGLPNPACTFALSPPLDLTLSSPSFVDNKKTDLFSNLPLVKKIAKLYVPSEDYKDPIVSPYFGDFTRMSPIQLHVGGAELLRDDSIRFYDKFKNDVDIDLNVWEDAPHCHQIFGFLPEAQVARKSIQSFIELHCPANT